MATCRCAALQKQCRRRRRRRLRGTFLHFRSFIHFHWFIHFHSFIHAFPGLQRALDAYFHEEQRSARHAGAPALVGGGPRRPYDDLAARIGGGVDAQGRSPPPSLPY